MEVKVPWLSIVILNFTFLYFYIRAFLYFCTFVFLPDSTGWQWERAYLANADQNVGDYPIHPDLPV